MWLDAYVTDFLTRARERNFAVPDVAFRSRSTICAIMSAQTTIRPRTAAAISPMRYYVLARNGVAPLGDLRYFADTKLDALKTPIAKAQLAAALGMLGDKTRAERVYTAALDDIPPQPKLELGRTDYGSALRDASAFVALASEGNAPRASILKAVERIEAARALSSYTSTQENAWMVLAARALATRHRQHGARCRGRDAARSALSQLPRERSVGGRSASPTTATRPCRRWSR